MDLFLKLFKALNANQYPGQIALSFILGMILGLTPLFFAHNLLTIALIFLLRINLSAVIVAFIFFSGLAYLLDPVFDSVGLWILQNASLLPMFTDMYNDAIWRLLHFNNSVVLGSVVIAYVLSVPAFIVFWVLVRTYREKFLAWALKFKIVQWLNRSTKVKSVSELVG